MQAKLRTVLDGGRYYEGPRWHAERLWFVDCMARTLLSIGRSGDLQEHALLPDDTPCGLGVLPDGTLVVLTMFRKRLLTFADERLSLYADLSDIAAGTIDDMIIDGLGRACVSDLGFDLPPPPHRGALGGSDRKTLFCISAATSPEEMRPRKSPARIDVLDVKIPGAGYP